MNTDQGAEFIRTNEKRILSCGENDLDLGTWEADWGGDRHLRLYSSDMPVL